MKKFFIIILILAVAGTAAWYFTKGNESNAKQSTYELHTLARGDLISTVSCSGTIQALSTVEVGTQIGGKVERLYADFNETVKKGQLLAELDTVLLSIAVTDARASYKRAEILLEEAQYNYDQNQSLFEQSLISEAELKPYEIKLKTQQYALEQAETAIIKAELNMDYAIIRSPVAGKVIERNVEEGQTVAASLSAPTLYLIAEDLAQMEIHAQVDESDIGQIKEGQKVTFDVMAYPDEVFSGTVKQIRLQPTTISNVVNYTVIIDAKNDRNLLLPGMTATVEFIVSEVKNVLLVPNTALRYSPPEDVVEAQKMKPGKKDKSAVPQEVKNWAKMKGGNQGKLKGENMGKIWVLDDSGSPVLARCLKGATDGSMTEIIKSKKLQEGMSVIIGDNSGGNERTTRPGRMPRLF